MDSLANAPVGILVPIAVLGIITAAVVSAGEAAVLKVSRSAVGEVSEAKPHLAQRLQALTQDTAVTATAAAFVRVVAEMIATACITVSIATAFTPWWLVVIVAALVSALVALVLVRISPRTLGRTYPAQVLSLLSGPMAFFLATSGWISRLVHKPQKARDTDEEDELRELVDLVDESEVIEDEERNMLRSVFELHETSLREIMVPRTDMFTLEANLPLRKAQELFVRSGFSRLPVVGDSADEVLGVLFFKDTARVLLNSSDPDSKLVIDVMRQVTFFPESKRVDELLREMQTTAQHIAMAVDEYGGVAGLVTIEDVIEEIVGELVDEHDVAAPEIEHLGPGIYRVPARLTLDELGELFDREIDDEDVDTVAGLLAKVLGKVPISGSSAQTHNLEITADSFAGRRKQLTAVIVSDTARAKAKSDKQQAATEQTSNPQENPA
ncbi:hemolysin family protein [Jonesiaceae bacterium BS-20]|uniref:Hemolysin family protein n=1 Tax=Jonesiaceae bacterium BS-20 TaxID=3120821 RepID=A0AAU7DQS3_9MICO